MRTGATFRVHGPDPERVTTALGMPPSRTGGQWSLSVEPADDTELEEPIRTLLATLEPHRDALARLHDDGYTFDFFCYLGSHATEHCAILTAAMLARVAALRADIWLDVYEDDFED
jgi:Domain of unknown function (DUF4279)